MPSRSTIAQERPRTPVNQPKKKKVPEIDGSKFYGAPEPKETKDQNSTRRYTKGGITDDRELIKQFRKHTDPMPWELITPREGVALKEGFKMKQGPEFGSSRTMTLTDETLRITANEYRSKLRSAQIGKGPDGDNRFSQTEPVEMTRPSTTLNVPRGTRQKTNHFSTLPPLETDEFKSDIKIHSARLFETLTKPAEKATPMSTLTTTDQHLMSAKSDYNSSIKVKMGEQNTMTKVDEFNMKILQAGDWGRIQNQYGFAPPVSFPKARPSTVKSTIGVLKSPREREARKGSLSNTESFLKSMRETKTSGFI